MKYWGIMYWMVEQNIFCCEDITQNLNNPGRYQRNFNFKTFPNTS